MPRAKPKVERQCLVCDAMFLGTPAATRCPSCKDAGLKVPRERQMARRKPIAKPVKAKRAKSTPMKETFTKSCKACGSEFETHKAKAARCDTCIAENRQIKIRVCCDCRTSFPLMPDRLDALRCDTCAEELGLDCAELSPEEIERRLSEQRRTRFKEKLEDQLKRLDQRAQPPKGYQLMSVETKLPINLLWLQMCAADGAAASLLYAGGKVDLTDAEKVSLLTSFFRLRVRGYHPTALAKLCPTALLKEEVQGAIYELPKVTEEMPQEEASVFHIEDIGRQQDAIALGLF